MPGSPRGTPLLSAASPCCPRRHPDKNPDNKGEATIKFQGIYNAYTRLTQEESSEEEDFEDYNEDPYDAAAQFFSRL